MSSSATSSSSAWTSMGLFCVTALASQVLQESFRRRQKRRRHRENQFYKMKRLADRLSYDDFSRLLDETAHEGTTAFENHIGNINDSSSPTQRRKQQSMDEGDSSQAMNLHPKNSNWRHFESVPTDDDEGSSTTTTSSEETAVWTSHQIRGHAQHRARTSSTSSWTSKFIAKPVRHVLKRSLGSFAFLASTTASEDGYESAVDAMLDENGDWADDPSAGPMQLYAGDEADATIPTAPPSPPTNGDDEHGGPILPALSQQRPLSFRRSTLRRYASNPDLVAEETQRHGEQQGMDLQLHNRASRASYNARIMPSKVVMIRHGQSEGNVDEALYSTTPDNAMRLTKLGWEQARKAGEVLKGRVLNTGEPVHFIVSPYVRTVETFHGIVSAWCDPSEFNHIANREKKLKAWYGRLLELGLTWHEDPRIREQDFGNYQDPAAIKRCKRERHRFGVFFYRFPHGESASDVFDRVSTFLDSLWRSFDLNRSRNYVLVTHGISIRVLLARYFRYSIGQFSLLANPKNCEMVILGHDGAGKLRLEGRGEPTYRIDDETGEKQVDGFDFHGRLRVLPKKWVRKVKVRISPDDDVDNDNDDKEDAQEEQDASSSSKRQEPNKHQVSTSRSHPQLRSPSSIIEKPATSSSLSRLASLSSVDTFHPENHALDEGIL